MNDNEIKKPLLRAFRDDVRLLAHILLIPVVASLRALAAFFVHLHDELAKV